MHVMKKFGIFVCITLVVLLLLGSIVSCTSDTRDLYFTESTYKLYLSDENPTITPEVFTRPRGNEYTLTVSNPTIAKVEGTSVKALKEGKVTLTATSGDFTATATLIVYLYRDASNDDDNVNDGKHTVYFISEYSAFGAQRVADGECATEPAPPLREGYRLFGWYMDEEFTTPYDFSTKVYSNLNLYALWSYDAPVYNFVTVNDKCYVSGFKYPYVPYEEITLPAENDQGQIVYGVRTSAFTANDTITSITIPDCYEVIEENAFNSLTKLVSVTIQGAGLKTIENLAFSNCTALTTFEFGGEGVTEIGASCFAGCDKLGYVNLPNSISKIGADAFSGCRLLTKINVPSSLKVIEARTFKDSGLTSIDLSGVQAIYNEAFSGATNLLTVTNPDSILVLGSYVFGSLLGNNSKKATAWLKNSAVTTSYEGKTGARAVYLGTALVYACPSYVNGEDEYIIGTKPQPVYIKQNVTTIAGDAFSDLTGACAYFLGSTPPTYGTNAFGKNSDTGAPTTDIIVKKGDVETFSRSFLVTSQDSFGDYSASVYSIGLMQKIYERVHDQLDPTNNGPLSSSVMLSYARYPLKAYSNGKYFSSEAVKNDANHDVFKGLTYDLEQRYYVINSYYGSLENLNLYEAYTNACGATCTPVIERICAFAFNANDTIKSISLPNDVRKIEGLAFMDCAVLEKLYLIGDASIIPYSYHVNATSFSWLNKNFKIYVSGQLDQYILKWGSTCSYLKEGSENGRFEVIS